MSARQAHDGAKTPIPNQDLCSTSWNGSRTAGVPWQAGRAGLAQRFPERRNPRDQRGLKGGSDGTRTRGLRLKVVPGECP